MSESEKPPQNLTSTPEPTLQPVPPSVSKKPDISQLPPASKYAWTMFLFHPVPLRSKKK